jgi:DNA-binding transcriptional LysR family regulator
MPASLSQLRHFIALADGGSFTAAAKLANRSQAAFSRSIAELEKAMGAALVDRIGHKNELTPLGRIVLDHARHIAADTEALERAVRVRAHAGTDLLRVGMSSTPLALLTQPLLSCAAASRGARVFVTGGPIPLLTRALQERRLDALVVDSTAVPAGAELVVEPLARLPTGFLCRSGHPLSGRARLRVQDLMAYPIASTSISEQVARGMVERFGPDAHPDRFVTLCCEEIAHLLDVVARSDAIYLGVLLGARARESSGNLVRLPFDTKGFDATFGLVRLAGRTEPLMLAMLRQLAAEVLVDAHTAPRIAASMKPRRRSQR